MTATESNVSNAVGGNVQDAEKELVFALDIGTRTVIGVIGHLEEDKFRVVDYEKMGHKGRAMIDGQVEDIAKVAELIGDVKEKLETRNNVKLTKVAVAAAGRMLRTVRTHVDRKLAVRGKIDEEFILGIEGEALEKAQEIIETEQADSFSSASFYCVGYSIVGYLMDGAPISNLLGHSCSAASVELIAAFLPYSVVESLYATVDMNGLEVVSLTLEPIAAINVLIPRELRLLNLALVDIGAGTSDIAICRDGSVAAYEMATVAGDEITESIIKKHLVDFETAEQMKCSLSSATGDISFVDILGFDAAVSVDALKETVRPTVELLAKTIAAKIVEINQKEPAAVFLVGGGSQIPGLTEAVADNLNIDHGKVAVGAKRGFRNIVSDDPALTSPDFVTPLGIALTSVTQQTFHFFGVTINDHKLKLLNTNEMRMMDVLVMAGYKANQILGRIGRSLSFTMNSEQKTIKGGLPTHATLTLNGENANIDSLVHPGDVINIVPAHDGETAEPTIADILPQKQRGSIFIDDRRVNIGSWALVNGVEESDTYRIQPKDSINVLSVSTLREACKVLNIDADSRLFLSGENAIAPDAVLSSGMKLVSLTAKQAMEASAAAEKPKFRPTSGGITVILNGENVYLPYSIHKSEYYVMDLLERAGVDVENPQGIISLKLNGSDANFADDLFDGCTVSIGWVEP